MIVQRITWFVKKGCMDEIVALLKEQAKESPLTTRAYTPNVGERGKFTVEFEFESLAEMEKIYADWMPQPKTIEFFKKWNDLTEPGGGSEILNLVYKK